jgi:hypothetical protein
MANTRVLCAIGTRPFKGIENSICVHNYRLESVLLTQYCAGDKIEKNEMGGACSAYGGEERCVQGFGGET